MQAWAGIAIAQAALIAFSLWRLSNLEGRSIHWRGAVLFVVAALALVVMVRESGYWAAIAIFGTIVLASDALFLKSTLVTQLCTRPAAEEPPAEAAEEPEKAVEKDAS